MTLILYLIHSFGSSNGEYKNTPDEEDEIIFQKYADMDKNFKSMVSYGIKRTLPMLMEASDRLNLTAKCMGNVLLLTTGIRKLKLSAINCKYRYFIFFNALPPPTPK